ncbi:PREDICTED: hemK methyltransferase family member 2 [Polistes canadensis]|uniref:hemK methyltransferase family member 2 n=1 Tax=Polistes canadensis TaxID=91411 RepID=UPI000718D939|nr:PREDICTED: hemK methyltransferase family member 2 [Polistes canadensis]
METAIVKLSKDDLETVYEPAEDSFCMLDALQNDLGALKIMKSVLCLEIGSGSGVLITSLAMELNKYTQGYYVAIDINPNACRTTKVTGKNNSVDINVAQMDLLNNIRYNEMFDIILFNPPYVVTDSEEVTDSKLISRTWAGGKHGREVMEKVFPHIPKLLSSNGIFYLVVIKENDPNYIIELFKRLNMVGTIVQERKIRGEHLFVMRFTKNSIFS